MTTRIILLLLILAAAVTAYALPPYIAALPLILGVVIFLIKRMDNIHQETASTISEQKVAFEHKLEANKMRRRQKDGADQAASAAQRA